MEKEIVIVDGVRTPFGRFGGSLKDMDYYELGALPMKELLKRTGIAPDQVDEVFWGVGDTSPCKDVFTPVAARQSLILAGLPPETPSISFDKACVSAMSAVKMAATAMKAGEIECAICGGATSFSQEPLILRKLRFSGHRIGDVNMEDPLFELGYKDYKPVSVDTCDLAVTWDITREMMDEWALRSHRNYGQAYEAGKFKDEMMTIEIPQRKGDPVVLDIDEQYRKNVTLERLAGLKPIYGSKNITAGNSPGLNDGATGVLVMTREKARDLGLEPIATLIASTSVANPANLMGETPAKAMRLALKKADMKLDDIDIIEINEAFAAVPLISTKELADGDAARWEKIKEKTNINGSAIAIGHPNTASGARIVMTLIYELRRRGGGYAMGAICGGLAQGDACILKVD
jgi:acetyl-CoA C-acetyltransferase